MSLAQRLLGRTHEPHPDPGDVSLPLGPTDLYEMLTVERRRLTLQYLHDAGGEIDIGPLSEEIASAESDKPVGLLRSKERKRVYVALYQTHLPKLDRVGLVEYDQDRGTIRATPATEQAVAFLEVSDAMLEGER